MYPDSNLPAPSIPLQRGYSDTNNIPNTHNRSAPSSVQQNTRRLASSRLPFFQHLDQAVPASTHHTQDNTDTATAQ